MRVVINIVETAPGELTQGAGTPAYFEKLGELFTDTLGELGVIPAAAETVELSVSMLTEADMGVINEKYRKISSATDVLSFPLWEEEGVFMPAADWETLPLGDVVVCPEVVARAAAEENKPFAEEFTLVLCHGLLHLCGFDHDNEDGEKKMWDLQSGMVRKFLEGGFNVQ